MKTSEVGGVILDILPKNELVEGEFLVVCSNLQAVKVAFEMARELNLKVELFLSKKIYAPKNEECEIGIVGETEEFVLNERLLELFGLAESRLAGQIKEIYEDAVLHKIYKFKKGKILENLAQKNILVVDFGVESGLMSSLLATSLRKLDCGKIYLAAFAAPLELKEELLGFYDRSFVVRYDENFVDVPDCFCEFESLSEEEILSFLEENRDILV